MHLLYIDDSGDDGRSPASSTHLVLGGLATEDWNWHSLVRRLDAIAAEFLGDEARRVELHGSDMLSGRGVFRSIPPERREALFAAVLGEIGRRQSQLSLFFVVIHKDSVPVTRDVRVLATLQLCQRFNSYLTRVGAFGKTTREHGMLICDEHAARSQIQSLMAVIHSGGLPKQLQDNLVETAFFVESHRSRLLQAADLACHAVYRFVTAQDNRFFHLVERKIDRDVDKKRLTPAGKPQVVHYGFRYVAAAPEVGLIASLPFKYLGLSASTKLPVGSFLPVAELEKELVAHGL